MSRRRPIPRLGPALEFPDPRRAPADAPLAMGGDLSPDRLRLAYRMGIFPWYSEELPVLWHSPDPRMGIIVPEFHLPSRLARTLRSGRFRLTVDTDFPAIIRACATVPRPTQDGTWITPEMIEAYERLHQEGTAHCVACHDPDDQLVGGIYGVAVGRIFCGESMFHTARDASKAALAGLLAVLRRGGFVLLDTQVPSEHLIQFGAMIVPRPIFLDLLDAVRDEPVPADCWSVDPMECLNS